MAQTEQIHRMSPLTTESKQITSKCLRPKKCFSIQYIVRHTNTEVINREPGANCQVAACRTGLLGPPASQHLVW